jgi:hypothetical protein
MVDEFWTNLGRMKPFPDAAFKDFGYMTFVILPISPHYILKKEK